MTKTKPTTQSAGGWFWVLLAGIAEVGFTYGLKMSQQDPRFYILFIACIFISFEGLKRSLKYLPLGIAYSVWTGIGAIGTIIIGAALFGEMLSPLRLGLLAILIMALLGLRLADKHP